MVLINSNVYADVKREMRLIRDMIEITTGDSEKDDRRLDAIQSKLQEIDERLVPATDER